METCHIIEAGQKLNVTTEVIANAFLLYHQFQKCVDEAEYDSHLAAAAALSISGKISEQIIDQTDLINVIYSISNKNDPMLEYEGDLYRELKQSLDKVEVLLGKTVKFISNHKISHKYLMYFLKSIIACLKPEQKKQSFNLVDKSVKLNSDFHMVKRSLLYPSEHIAVAVLDLAMQCVGIKLTSFEDYNFSWHKALCADLTESKIKVIIEDIIDSYNRQ